MLARMFGTFLTVCWHVVRNGVDSLFDAFSPDLLEFRCSTFVWKHRRKILRTAAVLSVEKEGYGCQTSAPNISLSLEIMHIGVFRFL